MVWIANVDWTIICLLVNTNDNLFSVRATHVVHFEKWIHSQPWVHSFEKGVLARNKARVFVLFLAQDGGRDASG